MKQSVSFVLPCECVVCMLSPKLGVANGKSETLRDDETGIFLCEPETVLPFKFPVKCKTEIYSH